MEEAGQSSPALRRAASALELEEMESCGDLPLLDEASSTEESLSVGPPLLSTPSPPTPSITPIAWMPPLIRQASKASHSHSRRRGRRTLKGPLRAVRLCLLAVFLPSFLVAGPLYLRFHIYADQVYPLAMSDMRLLDSRVSTTWCQRQVVRANATFNAFLLPEQPQVAPEKKSISMTRDLWLEDDMKEYWAFYLLRGSSITVSACVNHPGASLVVIRGHKHLHDCAYIGDNSSEELDEVEEAQARAAEEAQAEEATVAAAAKAAVSRRPSTAAEASAEDDSQPAVRRLARPEVKLLGAHPPLESKEMLAHTHPLEPDPEDGALRHILNKVAQKRAGVGRRRGGGSTEFQIPDGGAPAPPPPPPPPPARAPHPSLAGPVGTPSSNEVFEEVLRKLRSLGHRGNDVLRRLNHQLKRTSDAGEAAAAATAATAYVSPSAPPSTAGPTVSTPAATAPAPPPSVPAAADAASDDDSSAEAEILTDALSEPGAMDALRELVRRLLKEHAEESATPATQGAGGRHRRAGPAPRHPPTQHSPDTPRVPRKRHLSRSVEARLAAQRWSSDDEEDNVALEVEMRPDGIADHHERVNETEPGDLDSSNSEFWSSFSSSEEALLSCSGLVLNLPLHPHHQCTATADPELLQAAAMRNTLTYRVPTNGYYFFVFGSENEVQTNFIRAHFHLERVVYNVSSPVASCYNTTQPCALPLDFFSNEKLVLEMPVRPNASLWNEEFLVVSSCEPRTALYVACIVAVPMLIVMFAFQ